ncbi:ABC transporter ATP-binding protein [Solidesulfovibrio sp.]|uniref:ABC transporter ATP-binding protein n=1 Tax=Solidesulfovibrio sp. TaxID=2910990 RepID=UPI0026157629|nr:ABC transporter ATP-binding protein [Solidesulfovibrio sp.]
MSKAMLEVEKISKHFTLSGQKEPFCVFRDLSLQVREKEYLSVLGHSGCGKSTLLNIIAGIDTANSGHIILNGREVQEPGLDRMVVFQNFALMPWLTVFGNVRLAVRARYPEWSKQQVADWVDKYLDMVGLSGAANKRPWELSGGMRQRAGIARAFSVKPSIMLLDEPFAQIDALTRGVIQDELVRMWEETGITIFMVTHDVDEAILLSDRIMLMSPGPQAKFMDEIEVDIPRPRKRISIIEHPRFYEIRNRIISFLSQKG